MPEPVSTYRLNDLKLRWERDPSSRLFLQLADEYRKVGQVAEAVSVLEKGLEHRPNDLSAMVALGRCRLELEDVEQASELLDNVVARDPTHIVANKLLLDANLQMGDAQKAAQRLETYRLLNDRDPELDHFAYRLERLNSEEKTEASTVVAEGAFELQEETTKAVKIVDSAEAAASEEPVFEEMTREETPGDQKVAGSRENQIFDLAPSAAPSFSVSPVSDTSGGDLFALTSEPAPVPDLGALWHKRTPEKLGKEDPFAGLIRIESTRHWDLLSQEGIFSGPHAQASSDAEVVGDEAQARALAPEATPTEDAASEEAPAPVIEMLEEEVAPVSNEPEAVVGPEDPIARLGSQEKAVAATSEPADDSSSLGLMTGLAAAAGVAAATAVSNAEEEPAAPNEALVELEAEEPEPVALEPVALEPVELESVPIETVQQPEDASPTQESNKAASVEETTGSTPVVEEEADTWAPEPAAIETDRADHEASGSTDEVSPLGAEMVTVQPTSVEPSSVEPAAGGPALQGVVETDTSEPASATLGNLYLEQGHREEAGRIFHKVLEQEPDNPVARQGLARLEGRERPLTAADLLAVRSANGKIPEGLTAKKVLVLGNYVKQIRAGQHVH